jgi:hypothetical protein
MGVFICAMNANEISPKANARLNRIKIVSRMFRVLIGISVVILVLIACLALAQSITVCLGGSIGSGESMAVQLSLSPSEFYRLPADFQGAADAPDIPWVVMLLVAIRLGLTAYGIIALNRLFKLFERGIFFTVENVRYLKMQGVVMAGCGLTKNALQLLSPHKNISLNGLVIGLLILLIAWIMDEGRRIQEEQELTV